MSRARSNWMTMVQRPSDEVEVSEVTPEIVAICRSIGDATDAAIVSALAPGSVAVIWIVGKSTAGSADTPSNRYAKTPKTMNVAVINVVRTGRRIQSSDRFMVRTLLVAHAGQ